MGDRKVKYFVIENQIGELSSLSKKIEETTQEWKLSPELAMNINLAIEEAFSNIVFYAYNDGGKHKIKISLSVYKNEIKIQIADSGIPFNPLGQKAPDVSLPLEERSVGGLGIFLISQIMDEVEYARKDNQNILTLIKYMT